MFTRRSALKTFAGFAIASALPAIGCGKDEVPPPDDPVFGHGVASGDPMPDRVILWTRAAGASTVSGRWEMSKDATFGTIASSGTFSTDATKDWTVKIDVAGLEPGTTYFYRFTALGRTSSIGRTRTAPQDASQLRFAVVSCASVPHGYFHAYKAIAQRADVDAVVHLGDYIYEYADGDYGKIRESEPAHALKTLDDYRARYAQYRRDPDLQECHRQHPFINIWDDHEYADNAYRDGVTGDNKDIAPWPEQTAAAAQAYAEWIPIREQESDRKIWRALSYGGLVDLFLLDTRIWGRDMQIAQTDPALPDPKRQILGADQEAWLASGLKSSKAKWKLVAQQVMMAAVPSWFRDDGWDEYPAARDRFYDMIEQGGVADVIVLTGDVHSSWANELSRTPGARPLAVELITPAISAPGTDTRSAADTTKDAPFIRFVDLFHNGFMLLSVDAARAHAAWYHVENVEKEDGGTTHLAAGFATYQGDSTLRNEPVEPAAVAAAPPLAPA